MKKETSPKDFYLALLESVHPFYDRNGSACKMLFASDIKQKDMIKLFGSDNLIRTTQPF